MELENLSTEQLRDLERKIARKKKEAAAAKADKKRHLKDLSNDYVTVNFVTLQALSLHMEEVKKQIVEDANVIISLKQEALNISEKEIQEQQSHTLSNYDCTKSIIIGHNVVDGWDMEIASAAVSRVKDWLSNQVNEANQPLVEMIRSLLRPNKDGILKANRVLELCSQAQQVGDVELVEATDMLKEAYIPRKTTTFIKAKFRNDHGQDVWLSLSMSNV
jgi:hypothetical protein